MIAEARDGVVWGERGMYGDVVYYTLGGLKFAEIYDGCAAGFRVYPWNHEEGRLGYDHPVGAYEFRFETVEEAEAHMCSTFGIAIITAEEAEERQSVEKKRVKK